MEFTPQQVDLLQSLKTVILIKEEEEQGEVNNQ